jgi:putative flavoprotein involved in K+ transport
MSTEQVDVVIVGGGQAGLAMSYCLTEQGRPHVVLEQDRIAESWRSRRWDSLRLIAPNWSLRLPGFTYAGADPDGFMGKDEVVTHLEAYAHSFGTPIREGVRVTGVAHDPAGRGFRVQTQTEAYDTSQVVLATGALQQPNIPSCAADLPPGVVQIVASAYRTARQLPPGGVLVVGSGETGCQTAEELVHDGRPVYLCFGRSWWMPRRYRGRDVAAWMRPLGWFDRTVSDLPPGVRTGQTNPQLTGGDGGHDINANTLARQGVRLLGRLQAVRDGTVELGDDLAANLAWGDEQARTYLRAIDAHIHEQGLDAPEQHWPSDLRATADLPQESPRELNLAAAGIGTVIWATGYRPNFTWVGLPFLDAEGYPIHRRGVTGIPGLYVLGLDWLHTAKSGLFAGVGEDAAYLASIMADQPIATQPATTHATS